METPVITFAVLIGVFLIGMAVGETDQTRAIKKSCDKGEMLQLQDAVFTCTRIGTLVEGKVLKFKEK